VSSLFFFFFGQFYYDVVYCNSTGCLMRVYILLYYNLSKVSDLTTSVFDMVVQPLRKSRSVRTSRAAESGFGLR
jgi:hypothetical protein